MVSASEGVSVDVVIMEQKSIIHVIGYSNGLKIKTLETRMKELSV